jgi:hypothetical protein
MNSNWVIVASAMAVLRAGGGTRVVVPAAYSLVGTRDLFRPIAVCWRGCGRRRGSLGPLSGGLRTVLERRASEREARSQPQDDAKAQQQREHARIKRGLSDIALH